MYNQPYFIPSYYSSMAAPTMMRGAMGGALRGAGAMGGALRSAGAAAGASRGLGLFGRLGNSLSAIRGINWGGFITNASKTLGVINQAIPLVRQVGPMMNNMKSMLRVASIFKDETDKRPSHSTNRSTENSTNVSNNNLTSNRNSSSHQNQKNFYSGNSSLEREKSDSQVNYTNSTNTDSSPTFFIGA